MNTRNPQETSAVDMTSRGASLSRLVGLALALGLLLSAGLAAAERGGPKTTSRLVYHGGEVMGESSNVYFILYGCRTSSLCPRGWDDAMQGVLADFIINLGGSPYQRILTTYPDVNRAPSGGLVFGGAVNDDLYSHGSSLTEADVQDVVLNMVLGGALPWDTRGIYYGQTYTTPNGAQANMRLGARDYLIQQNWVNSGRGYCALSYP